MRNSNSNDPRELIECIEILAADADESWRQMQATGSDLAKRHFVRAVFAWIDALSYLFRQAALSKIADGPLTPETIPTLLALQERTYTINEKGVVTPTLLKAPTSSMLLFSLKTFAESQGLSLGFDKGGQNWQAYVQALAIRDRITHPKKPSDVHLSDKDIDLVEEAKGMILGYLEVVLNPDLIAIINAHRNIAIAEGREITLTFTEDDLKHFKEQASPSNGK